MRFTLKKAYIAWKALQQLGTDQVSQFAIHKLKEITGLLRLLTPSSSTYPEQIGEKRRKQPNQFPLQPPSSQVLHQLISSDADSVIDEADEILQGRLRYFGGDSRNFSFAENTSSEHWSKYKPPPGQDIKFIWEPARFAWVYPLCRAYILTGNEKYAEGFTSLTRLFALHHPPNCGPHWVSAQEVGLRLMALLFGVKCFASSPSLSESGEIINIIIAHARRIPPTFNYARAQNNNHLISEALALYCAGTALPWYSESIRWRKLGWRWLVFALSNQIDLDGTFIQHSTNYHRLMLQAALLGERVAASQGMLFPPEVKGKLANAASWLITQMDPISGRVPNLGHNDGAYILPLASGGFEDYRPVCQAAAIAFLNQRILPTGPWDEFSHWMNLDMEKPFVDHEEIQSTAIHKISSPHGWASIRAATFHSRPAHADQLHVDLWWNGVNIAIDPGTYAYNLPSPWDNALMGTDVHNTLYLENKDQMTRAGRFLWLDWVSANVLEKTTGRITALLKQYDGLGIQHKRTIQWESANRFTVNDLLLSTGRQPQPDLHFRLQWQLPDWELKQKDNHFWLNAPFGIIKLTLEITANSNKPGEQTIRTFRGGETLTQGTPLPEYLGWASSRYGTKSPIRTIHACFRGKPPLEITTIWQFSE